jgi:hypothetical protein
MRRTIKWTSFTVLGVALVYGGCGGESTEPPPPDPEPSRVSVVSGSGQNGTVGQQLAAPLVVRIDDQSGNSMSGVTVSFEVAAGGGTVGSASTTTSAGGEASTTWTLGTEAGAVQQARAAVPGTNLTALFTATAEAGAPVAISPESGNNQSAYRGSKLPDLLVVLLRDQFANGVSNQLVQFAAVTGNGSVDSAVAFTDATGRARSGWVLGTDLGTQTAQAVAQGVTGSPVTFSAEAHNLNVASVSPDPIVLGGTATITGTGFDAAPGNNVVTIGGIGVSVTAASATQLDVAVPDACLPAGPVAIQVAVAPFTSAPDTNNIMPQSSLLMSVGEQVIVQDPDDFCLQFAEATGFESYLIGVQSTSEAVTSVTPITLSSALPLGSAAPAPSPSPSLRASRTGRVPLSLVETARSRRLRQHRAAEANLRELDQRNFETLRYQRPLPQRTSPGDAAIDPNADVGDTVQVRVISDNSCSDFTEITTVVQARGDKGIFLEDIANPSPGYTLADFQSLSTQFEDFIYDTDVAYFGTPLDQDANSRAVIVVTKEVNERGSLGFTSSCDYFDRVDAPASNEGEYFYQEAPDPAGDHGEAFSAADAIALAPTILAHELVHIIQFSERIRSGGGFPSIWIAEGQATYGEEIVGHADENRSVGQNLELRVAINWDDTLSIDWYSDRVADMGFYFGWDPISDPEQVNNRISEAPHGCSWLALPPANPGPCVGGRDAYGVPWTLLRWLSDQFGGTYPGGEQALQHDMLANTLNGFELIESLVGVSIDTLLAQWAAMLYVDDWEEQVGGLGNPRLEMTSWNLYDIFYGSFQSGDVVVSLIEALRLEPNEVQFGQFTRSAEVRGGSTYYSIISGTDRSAVAVKAADAAGASLPANMQVWVVRMK